MPTAPETKVSASPHRIAIASLLVSVCTLACAGRPLVTEDAAVIEKAACEVESFAARTTERGSPSVRGTSLQLACGIVGHTQLALASATARSGGESERSWTFAGKTAVAESSLGAWALAWGLAAVQPAGTSLKHETSFVNGVLTMPLNDSLKLHANLGWSRSQSDRQSRTGWSLALERNAAAGIDVMGETFANDRDKSPWIQFGLRWAAVQDRLFLDASWGRQTSSSRPTLLTVGLKAAF
jgi:hypothetical protein